MTAFTADAAAALGGPDWLAARRLAAHERVSAAAPPTSNEEIWRYSRIDDLVVDDWRPAPRPDGPVAVPGPARAALLAAGELAGHVIVVNGRVVEVALDPAWESKGVVLGELTGGDAPHREALGRVAAGSPDWFTDLHDAFLPGAAIFHVPAGVVVDRPVLVVQWSEGEGLATFPHLVVVAGERSEATIAEYRLSTGGRHLVDAVTEMELADGAHLSHVALQDHGPSTWDIALQRATVGRDATLRSSSAALGGDYARVRAEAFLGGQGGDSRQVAVYFAHGDQMHDVRTLSDHDAPRTTSNLVYKGAVDDRARSVYSGLIHLRPDAQKASAHQTNRNLVLAPPPAGAESIPNLQIEANDVQCSHASAIGPIDEDQRYYLESRGVPPAAAERLIVGGFFEDVLAEMPVGALGDPVRTAVAARFDRPAAGVGRG